MSAHIARGALLVTALVVSAPLSTIAPAQDAPIYADSLLWRLEHPSGHDGYLFGTMHVDDARALALVEHLRGPIGEVEIVYTELSFEEAQAMSGDMMAIIFDPSRPPLDEVLGEALFDRLLAELRPYGVNAAALRNMPGWLAATLTFYPDQMSSGTFVDVEVEALARELGRPVAGLESVEEQLAILRELNTMDQRAMVAGALDFLDDHPNAAEDMTAFYAAGDLPGLWTLVLGSMVYGDPDENDAMMESALYDRNAVMAERIEAVLTDTDALFAVGAAHLPDDRGVLDLLVEEGVTVTPVTLDVQGAAPSGKN